MTRFCTQLNRSVTILHPRKNLKYQHIFEYRPVSFYAVDYCTDVLCIKDGVKIDPCCGSGGMFVQSLKFVDRYNGNRQKVLIIGQESMLETWRLCKMNLVICGISHNLGEKNASTFTEDLHKDENFDISWRISPFKGTVYAESIHVAGNRGQAGCVGKRDCCWGEGIERDVVGRKIMMAMIRCN